MNARKFLLGILVSLSVAFLATGLVAQPFFGGLEDNLLEKSQREVERDAELLRKQFTRDEAEGLKKIVAEVRDLLQGNLKQNLLRSDIQKKLLVMEKEWRKREGAWIVVKLLEGIRIKSQLFLQNAYLLERLPDTDSERYRETVKRMENYRVGVELSNNTLEKTIEDGYQGE